MLKPPLAARHLAAITSLPAFLMVSKRGTRWGPGMVGGCIYFGYLNAICTSWTFPKFIECWVSHTRSLTHILPHCIGRMHINSPSLTNMSFVAYTSRARILRCTDFWMDLMAFSLATSLWLLTRSWMDSATRVLHLGKKGELVKWHTT